MRSMPATVGRNHEKLACSDFCLQLLALSNRIHPKIDALVTTTSIARIARVRDPEEQPDGPRRFSISQVAFPLCLSPGPVVDVRHPRPATRPAMFAPPPPLLLARRLHPRPSHPGTLASTTATPAGPAHRRRAAAAASLAAAADPGRAITDFLAGPLGEQLTFGGVTGFAAGYALNRLGRIALLAVGVQVLTLQAMAHRGWVSVHWSVIADDVDPGARAARHGGVARVVNLAAYRVPFAGAFTAVREVPQEGRGAVGAEVEWPCRVVVLLVARGLCERSIGRAGLLSFAQHITCAGERVPSSGIQLMYG